MGYIQAQSAQDYVIYSFLDDALFVRGAFSLREISNAYTWISEVRD